MTQQQQQQQQQQAPQAPQAPQQAQQAQQPNSGIVNPSYISFNTTGQQVQQQAQQVPANLLANKAAMIEDYQAAAAQNEQNTPDAYQAIIAQQQAQIEALIAQTNAQSEQITRMVQGGAQFQQAQQPQPAQFIPQQQAPQQVNFPGVYQPDDTQAHPLAQFNLASLVDDADYSLESLAEEIGKRGE